MSGVGGGLSKLGVVLTVILLLTLIALMAQLIYVLWRRRVVCHRSGGDLDGDGLATDDRIRMYSSSPDSAFSSRELLYFFCIKSKSSGANSKSATVPADSGSESTEAEVVEIDVLALNGMFGPPRLLFTIKEEEREGWESPEGSHNKLSLKEFLKFEQETVTVEGSDNTTPFSTPCFSPLYFTPSASPIHDSSSPSHA
ncbi:hypothetical protein M569_15211 [Genlisea aurea]|uniref:Uncharacterized protein n=1 Tax=Genlisea aurea TaxID=192259 RepID=S8BYB0_9LAMI|nr:hypothetical protein M569_15211 [Genlisea aurea]